MCRVKPYKRLDNVCDSDTSLEAPALSLVSHTQFSLLLIIFKVKKIFFKNCFRVFIASFPCANETVTSKSTQYSMSKSVVYNYKIKSMVRHIHNHNCL